MECTLDHSTILKWKVFARWIKMPMSAVGLGYPISSEWRNNVGDS